MADQRDVQGVSLGPHCAVFRMRKLKPQVAKVSTVRVEKILALAVKHSHRNCKSHLSSSPNWLVVIERAHLSYFSASFQ